MKDKSIILASQSPRRKELLAKENIKFTVVSMDIEEIMDESLPLPERLEQLAKNKALAVFKQYPEHVIIGADTIVCLRDTILQKPKDKEDAYHMLSLLSGNTHTVYTAVAILYDDEEVLFCESTKVNFKTIDKQELEEYLLTDEWCDKAGGYAIQGISGKFVESITGDMNTVIGFPVEKVISVLKEHDII